MASDYKDITGHSNDEAFGHNIFMATNDMFSAGDPRLQELIDGGYIKNVGGGGGDGGNGGQWVITDKAPQRAFQTTMAPTKGEGGTNGSGMFNPNAVQWDPFYGNITSRDNIAPSPATALDKYGPMVAGALAGGIGLVGGLGAAAGGTGGLAGASSAMQGAGLANVVPGLAQSAGSDGGFNPWGAIGTVAGAFSPAAGKAIQLASLLRQRMG